MYTDLQFNCELKIINILWGLDKNVDILLMTFVMHFYEERSPYCDENNIVGSRVSNW